MKSDLGEDRIALDGGSFLPSGAVEPSSLLVKDELGQNRIIVKGDGTLLLYDDVGRDSIILDGDSGDIGLGNADCAEEFNIFNIDESTDFDPGTVMIIDQYEKLRQSHIAYDKRVAGVISWGVITNPELF